MSHDFEVERFGGLIVELKIHGFTFLLNEPEARSLADKIKEVTNDV